jgi:hypothetical protein
LALDSIPRFLFGGKLRKFLALGLVAALAFLATPSLSAQAQRVSSTVNQANVQPGVCPNWGLQTKPYVSGIKFNRSGNRKIFIEWSLSISRFEGGPVARTFNSDEAEQIRAAVAMWDSVFETIDFREVSGDYAAIKIGTSSMKDPTWNLNYFSKSMTFGNGQISTPQHWEGSYGLSRTGGHVFTSLGVFLGAGSISMPLEEKKSRLRQLYGENSCYPVELTAEWNESNGLSRSDPWGGVGSTQKLDITYSGLSQIGVTVRTPKTCKTSNFTATPQTGVLVTITGVGVCSIMVEAREGGLPSSSQVKNIRTGLQQKITVTGLPKELKVGKSVTLKGTSTSRLPVTFSKSGGACIIVGNTVKAGLKGTCKITASAESGFGPLRYAKQYQSYSITVKN